MDEEPKRRSIAVRLLLCLLSLFLYGLGLARVGQIRRWLAIEGGGLAALMLVVLFWAAAGSLAIKPFIVTILIIFAIVLAVSIAAAVETWRHSQFVMTPRPWPSRWYGLILLWIVAAVAYFAWVALAHQFYKPWSIPSPSMLPTLARGDKLVADMRGGRDPKIGEIVLYRSPSNDVRVGRIAALPGMTIEIRGSTVILNGRSARLQRGAPYEIDLGYAKEEATSFTEVLPGEAGAHEILDSGWRPTDEMRPVKLAAGQIFILGDNRDMAADSRVPLEQLGVGIRTLDTIVGKPMFIYWRQGTGFTAIPIGQTTPTK